MLAQHVEAHGLGRFDVEAQGLVARRGVEPVGPPALVEQAVHEAGLAVEQQALLPAAVLADADGAQGEVALHPVLAERELQLVEIWFLRGPRPHVLELEQRALARGELVGVRSVYHGAHRALAAHVQLDRAVLQMGRYEERCDVVFRHALAPDGLPDAAHGRIPDAAGLELLLAARMV